MGWVTVAGYFGASLACLAAARVRLRDRGFWYFLAIVLLLLGINKQLDLQSALTAVGRCVSQLQGWYGDRRQVQFFFIMALLTFSGIVMLSAIVGMRASLHRVGIALLGFGMLLTFVAVRAIGFHHFDAFLGTRLFGARMNWILELGGISLILLNAIFARIGARTRRTPRAARPEIRSARMGESPYHRTFSANDTEEKR